VDKTKPVKPVISKLHFLIRQGDDVLLMCAPIFWGDHPLPPWLAHLPGDEWFDLCSLWQAERNTEFGEN
jgi:hypothetical protein